MERPVTWVEERGEAPHSGLYLVGTRIPLHVIVGALKDGETRLDLAKAYTWLSLDQIDGAIAYYEAHQQEVDERFAREEAWVERMRQEDRAKNPEFYAKMEAAKREILQRAKE